MALTKVTYSMLESAPVNLRDFGAVGDGVTDDTTAVVNFFAFAKTEGKSWFVPPGSYLIDPASPIDIVTSGTCEGEFRLPQTNTTSYFNVVRDTAGTVVSASAWNALTKGTWDANATNAKSKNIYIASSEILIERIGLPLNPYLKQEFIRVDELGRFTTPLCNTYLNNAALTVTAHTPSEPIIIDGLKAIRFGTSAAVTQTIRVVRDNVTLNNPTIVNENPASPLAQALVVAYCADVTLNKPRVNGTKYAGLGYGILVTGCIATTINDAVILDAREALTGTYSADTTINRGSWEVIDHHWGNRMFIKGAKIFTPNGASAIQYAGDTITIEDIVVTNGRNVLGIRTDTPSLGGTVVMRNINITSYPASGSTYYVFGFTSPSVNITGTTFTNKPTMPDVVTIDGVSWDISASYTSATVCFLSCLDAAHTNWGSVVVTGNCSFKGATNLRAIFLAKDATYQQDRAANLIVNGNINCGTGNVIYTFSADADNTRASTCTIEGASGALRLNTYATEKLLVRDASLSNVINDDATETFTTQQYQFNNCNMTGTSVSGTLRNLLFTSCVFETEYATWPFSGGTSYATLIGNVSLVAQPNMPSDIRANINPPYNGV